MKSLIANANLKRNVCTSPPESMTKQTACSGLFGPSFSSPDPRADVDGFVTTSIVAPRQAAYLFVPVNSRFCLIRMARQIVRLDGTKSFFAHLMLLESDWICEKQEEQHKRKGDTHEKAVMRE